jgi:hypothetical protein
MVRYQTRRVSLFAVDEVEVEAEQVLEAIVLPCSEERLASVV